MKLFEYQAKEIFAAAGIPVPQSKIIESAGELSAALSDDGFNFEEFLREKINSYTDYTQQKEAAHA